MLMNNNTEKVDARTFTGLLLFLTATAFALRIIRIGVDEMWLDETISAVAAMGPVGDILRGVHSPKSPPLYYLLLKVWSSIFGCSEISMRGMSAVAGTALVVLTGVVGTRLFSRRAGLAAAGVAAVAPLGVYYSMETRSYILLSLFALGYTYFSLMMTEKKDRRTAAALVACGIGLAWTHAYGLLLLPLPNILLLSAPARRNYSRLLGAQGLTLVGVLLVWVPIYLRGSVEMAGWVQSMWDDMGPGTAFLRSFQILGAGASYPRLVFRLWQPPAWWISWPATVFFAAVVTTGLAWKPDVKGSPARRLAVSGVLLSLIMPLVLAYVISEFWKPVYLVGRTDFIAAPAFYLLAGVGLARMKKELLAGCVVAIILFSSYNLFHLYTRQPFNAGRSAAAFVARASEPDDIVLCTCSTCFPIEYYLEKDGEDRKIVPYPLKETAVKNSYDPEFLLKTPNKLEEEANIIVGRLAEESERGDEVFVVEDSPRFGRVNILLFEELRNSFRYIDTSNKENGMPVHTYIKK